MQTDTGQANSLSEKQHALRWVHIPYPDGVAIECIWSVDGVQHFHRPECTLQYLSDLLEWYWSDIWIRRKYANRHFKDTLWWHCSVLCEWHWSGSNGAAMECALRSGIGVYFGSGIGVAMNYATEVVLECTANVQINTAMPLAWQWSGRNGVLMGCILHCHPGKLLKVALEWWCVAIKNP